MLADFKQLLIENELYFESRICDLESSCSISEKLVIDFDKVKEEFWKRFKKNESRMPKSADALILNLEKNELTFIEMKNFENDNVIQELNSINSELKIYTEIIAKTDNEKLKNEKRVLENFANIKFQQMFSKKFEADKKLIDSYALLFDIAIELNANLQFYPFLLKEVKKRFIFVLNMTAKDYVRNFISSPTIQSRYDYYIFNRVAFIQPTVLDNAIR